MSVLNRGEHKINKKSPGQGAAGLSRLPWALPLQSGRGPGAGGRARMCPSVAAGRSCCVLLSVLALSRVGPAGVGWE